MLFGDHCYVDGHRVYESRNTDSQMRDLSRNAPAKEAECSSDTVRSSHEEDLYLVLRLSKRRVNSSRVSRWSALQCSNQAMRLAVYRMSL